jgi:hypothetical protein
MQVFPSGQTSNEEIDAILDRFMSLRKVVPFTYDGKFYGWLKNFHKRQTIDRPRAPVLPLPSWLEWHPSDNRRDSEYILVGTPDYGRPTDGQGTAKGRPTAANGRTDAADGRPTDGQGTADGGVIEVKRSEVNTISPRHEKDAEGSASIEPSPITKKPRRKTQAGGEEEDPAFERFWSVYPRKIAPSEAHKKWRVRLRETIKAGKHKGEPVTADLLIRCAVNYAKECDAKGTEPTFIKHPETFLGPTQKFADYLDGPAAEVAAPHNRASPRPTEHRYEPYQHEAPATPEEELARDRALQEHFAQMAATEGG